MVQLFSKKITLVFISLVFLILLSFLLRFYVMPTNLFFGPEQGRDFLVIRDIVISHKFTLIGPKTDIAGVFHGPVFYYLSALPFLLSHGNPLMVSLFLIIIQAATVIGVYFLGKDMFGKRVGILAAIIFTFSFGAIVYARWLSNPPLSIPVSVLFFLFLWRFLKGKKMYLPYAALLFGILGQVEFINFIFYGLLVFILLIIYRKEFFSTNKVLLLLSVAVLVVSSIGNFVLFDIRHEFLITKSVIELLVGKSGFYLSFVDALIKALTTFLSVWSYFIFPNNFLIATTIFLFGIGTFIATQKKSKQSVLVLLWVFVPLLTLIILKHDALDHFFVGSAVAYILILSVFVNSFINKKYIFGLIVLFFVVGGNVLFWKINIPLNRYVVFQTTQPELTYSDELHVIESVYARSQNKPFEIQAYTIPYWSQQAWEYLFWYRAQKDNKIIPMNGAKMIFVIIQKDISNEPYQKDWLEKTVSKWGKKKDSFSFGVLEVWELSAI